MPLNIKELIKKGKTKVIRTKDELKEEFKDVVPMVQEKVEQVREDVAAKIDYKKLEKENQELLEDPFPAIMSPRFHFYRGVVFTLLMQVVALLGYMFSTGAITIG